MWTIGLTMNSVAFNAELRGTEGWFNLLSDPKGNLLNAIGFDFSKGKRNVGVLAIDKKQIIHCYSFGNKNKVLDRWYKDIRALTEQITERERQRDEEEE